MNHATSPKLYRSYYPHQSRDSLSAVCGIFLDWNEMVNLEFCNFDQIVCPYARWLITLQKAAFLPWS